MYRLTRSLAATTALMMLVALVCVRGAALGQDLLGDSLAASLAAWIVEYRDAAIAQGAAEIPPEIRAPLEGHVPAAVLDRVRWRVDGAVSLVGMNLFFTGPVSAVTLDHVILFADYDEAADATLWAHELYHVMQYAQWGVAGFAARYLADHRAVEHDAREFRWSWMKATGRIPKV